MSPAAVAAAAGHKSVAAWVKTHQSEALGLGAGGLVAGVLLLHKLSGSATTTAAAAPAAPTGATPPTIRSVSAGQIPTSPAEVALPYTQPKTTGSKVVPYAAPKGEVVQGSGYWVPNSTAPIKGSDGHTYVWISSAAQLAALQGAGGTSYVQVTPGNFVEAEAGLGPDTPQFMRQG